MINAKMQKIQKNFNETNLAHLKMFQLIGFRPSEINLIFNETTASGTVLASVEKDADGSKQNIFH